MGRTVWRAASSRPDAMSLMCEGGTIRMWRWLLSVIVVLAVTVVSPSVVIAAPAGTISFSVGANPTEGVPLSIVVSGTTEVAGDLTVNFQRGGCAARAFDGEVGWENATSVGSATVSVGDFHETYSVTPGEPGAWAVCGYLYEPHDPDLETATYATATEPVQVAINPKNIPPPEQKPEQKSSQPAPAQEAKSATPAPPAASAPSHLMALMVTVRAHAGSTASKPGRTELLVHATGGTFLFLTLKHKGHTRTEEIAKTPTGTFVVPWSCSAPGGVYSYAITATDAYGASLTRSGRFRPVSAAQCRALRAADERRRSAEARERHEQEEQRRHEGHEAEHQDERVRSDQRVYCEQVLGGNVEQVFNGNMIPAVPSEIETECSAHGRNYTLRGDPPVVVNETP